MKKIISIIVVIGFIASCATVPENDSYTLVDDLQTREFAAVLATDFESNEETAAFAGAAGQALGTTKVLPDVPDRIAAEIAENLGEGSETQLGAWFDNVVEAAQNAFEFDTLVVAFAVPNVQYTTILGITVRTQPVTTVYSIAVNVDAGEVIAQAIEHVPFNDKSAVGSITAAGRNGMQALLEAPIVE